MRASLIIAAHNEGQRLPRTVQSCVETAGALDYEIVIADDASTDGSVAETLRQFPSCRLVRHAQRLGASPTKHAGALAAKGEILVFLDGHTKPEPGALERMVADAELVGDTAIITPRVAALDTGAWRSILSQVGSGYYLTLDTFACGWLGEQQLRSFDLGMRRFYESPALIGCALAISRSLYERLRGFDAQMYVWGSEDVDLGLKCWLMGCRILHDPAAIVGHRFRATFDNYSVPSENVVVNQLRMARKNFTDPVWEQWIEHCRSRWGANLFTRARQLFERDRASVEAEREYLLRGRVQDEFWYARRFKLPWPRLADEAPHQPRVLAPWAVGDPPPSQAPSGSPPPSPSPSPQGLTLFSVAFSGKGNVELVQNATDKFSDDGDGGKKKVRVPQFQADQNPAAVPICFVKSSSPTMDAVITIGHPATPIRALKVAATVHVGGKTGPKLFYPAKDAPLQTNPKLGQIAVVTLLTTDKVPANIDNTTFEVQWTVSINGGAFQPIGPNPLINKLFILWNNPQPWKQPALKQIVSEYFGQTIEPGTWDVATVKRVDWATDIARGQTTAILAGFVFADTVGRKPGHHDPDDKKKMQSFNSAKGPWPFLDSGDPGDCLMLAATCATGLGIIGVKAFAYVSFPTTDGPPPLTQPVTGNSCLRRASRLFVPDPAKPLETKLAHLVYEGNNFEGFFQVVDAGSAAAFTAYPIGGPFVGPYFKLYVLRHGMNYDNRDVTTHLLQFWQYLDGTAVQGVAPFAPPEIPAN